MKMKMVIYHDGISWVGAGEFLTGRWPFRKVNHAPVTHAYSAQEVFSWLLNKYPDRVISLEPSLSQYYGRN